MYCNKCGKEIATGALFCVYCGAPVKKINDEISTKSYLNTDEQGSDNQCINIQTNQKKYYLDFQKLKVSALEITKRIYADFKKFVDKLELNRKQKTVTALAFVASLGFLISLDGSLRSWLTAIGGIILVVLCAKKHEVTSVVMVLPMIFFACRFLIVGLSALFGKYYFAYSILSISMRYVIYIMTLSYCLWVVDRVIARSVTAVLFGVFACAFILLCSVGTISVFLRGFRTVSYYLGQICFVTCYTVLFYPYVLSKPDLKPDND